jgi:hypothetical protein
MNRRSEAWEAHYVVIFGPGSDLEQENQLLKAARSVGYSLGFRVQ